MIVIVSALAGALLGALRARRMNGNGYDIAQYAAVFGLIGALLGLFVAIYLQRAF